MKKWKENLARVKNLRREAAALVYDRVKLLVAVYEDPEFLADEGLDALSAARRLDDELADVCAGFLEMKAVLEFYPERKQWEGRRLDLIVAEVLSAERERHAALSEPRPPVKRVTKAEHAETVKELELVKKSYAELEADNRSLLEEVGRLKYRISELESLLSIEMAKA